MKTQKNKGKNNINFFDYVDKKNMLRPVIQGVYHDPSIKVAVASNMRLLISSEKDYQDELAEKIILADGNFIDGKYPIWQCLIPEVVCTDPIMEITKKIEQKAEQFIANRRKAGFSKKSSMDNIIISKQLDEGKIASYRYDLYCKFYTAAKYMGLEKVKYFFSKENIHEKLLAKENNNNVLLMPRLLNLDKNQYTTDIEEINKILIIWG